MAEDLMELARDLSRRGEPFALATVVWRRAPSSAQPGNKAIVTAAGKVRGFLSGACSESVVIREARKAMERGEACLVLLGSPEELAARANDGIELVVMACQSEGAIELFIEPVLPTPHLVVVGRTPMVDTLVTLARTVGWRTVVVDDQGDPEAHPQAGQVGRTLDFPPAGAVGRTGHPPPTPAERRVEQPAAADDHAGHEHHAHAGHEHHGHAGHEHHDHGDHAAAAGPAGPTEAVDPVCGMLVETATAR